MQVLAVNISADSVFANPRLVKNKKGTAAKLAAILGLDENFVLERLSRDKGFVWIKRRISRIESERIKELKIEGIELIEESRRVYPDKALACHVIGTVNIDNVGLEGVELYYDKYLRGESGWLISTQDARRKLLKSYQFDFIPPKNGLNLVLTIDEVIQSIAERELYKSYKKNNAKAASIVVMDPRTGAVLALANIPNFDLNNVNKREEEAIRDRAVNDFFEPGSVFKVITASALIEEGLVKLNDTFFCEYGEWKTGSKILHDVHPYGNLTFKEVIEKSSNIGTVKAASRLGPEKMYKYIKEFGFLDKTGIDLPGEVVGINRPPSKWSKVSMNAIPIGQEVTVTAMQLACAISVIANNGFYVKPRIVKEIIDDNGEVIKSFPPVIVRKVLSPETAVRVRHILKGAVENGTGKKARVEDFKVGGKTGTAQKIEGGTYSHSKFIGSFIGFAPADKPLLTAVICIDEPHPVYYGGDVSAPVFKEVADQVIKYLNVKGLKAI
ncbi:MAG: penicillin-binding protein 2 [Candidatus Omnitrophica bacterium]|nr:penicillin-binding protein 2 [Candidatus Omnitrophota bacterium]